MGSVHTTIAACGVDWWTTGEVDGTTVLVVSLPEVRVVAVAASDGPFVIDDDALSDAEPTVDVTRLRLG